MLLIVVVLLIPVAILLWRRHGMKDEGESVSLMVVLGSGGHTTEILRLVSSLSPLKYYPRVYIVAKTDTTSEEKIHLVEKQQPNSSLKSVYHVIRIPRSREVGQSWLSTVASTAQSTLSCFPLILQWKPRILLCNGPGTCVPLCLLAIAFKCLCLVRTKVVYVESICRVYDLSMSAKILYRLADHLLVQWPELQLKYPKSLYLGRFY